MKINSNLILSLLIICFIFSMTFTVAGYALPCTERELKTGIWNITDSHNYFDKDQFIVEPDGNIDWRTQTNIPVDMDCINVQGEFELSGTIDGIITEDDLQCDAGLSYEYTKTMAVTGGKEDWQLTGSSTLHSTSNITLFTTAERSRAIVTDGGITACYGKVIIHNEAAWDSLPGPPPAPPNIRYPEFMDQYNYPDINWAAIDYPGRVTYVLQRDSSADFSNPVKVYEGAMTTHIDTSATLSQAGYYYRVRAITAFGEGPWRTGPKGCMEINVKVKNETKFLVIPNGEITGLGNGVLGGKSYDCIFSIKNDGTDSLLIQTINVTGTAFSVKSPIPDGSSISPGGWRYLTLTGKPVIEGQNLGNMEIIFDVGGGYTYTFGIAIQGVLSRFDYPVALTNGDFGAYSVTAADKDGDGDTDIAAGTYGQYGSVWFKNEDGDGSAWEKSGAGGSGRIVSVSTANVDSDGDMELLAASNSYGNIYLQGRTIDTNFPLAESVSAADLDGDGDMDVLGAAEYADHGIKWWENTEGDGTAWKAHNVGTDFKTAHQAFGIDMDTDGDTDVLGVANGLDSLSWWENTDGSAANWTRHGLANGGLIYPSDIDADGDMDFVRASGGMTWWENSKGGDATAWKVHIVNAEWDSASSTFPWDIDGDGDMDILGTSKYDDRISWWENIDTKGTLWTQSWTYYLKEAMSIFAADVNGDGLADIIASGTEDILLWKQVDYTNIEVHGNEMLIPKSDSSPSVDDLTDFGTVAVGNSLDHEFTLHNAGNTPLTITLPVSADGDGFIAVMSASDADIPVGGSASLNLHFAPVKNGINTAMISIAYDDERLQPYVFTVQGEGLLSKPEAPSALSLSAVSKTGIDLAWEDNSDNESGFKIFRNSLLIHTTAVGQISFSDTGLECGTQYSYEITSTNSAGDSSAITGSKKTRDCNQPPESTGIDNIVVEINAPETRLDLWSYFSDLEDGAAGLSYEVSGNTNPDLFSLADILENRYLTLNYAADSPGISEISIKATDRGGFFAAAAFTVTIKPVNSAPVAERDIYTMPQDTTLKITAPGILANDNDLENNALTSRLVNEPEHGTLNLDADGGFIYTPTKGYFGLDRFSYQANDGHLNSETAKVFLEIEPMDSSCFASGIKISDKGISSVYTSDMDGDGDLDVLGAAWRNEEIIWWENMNGKGDSWTEHVVATGFDGAYSVSAEDMDDDGDMDVLGAAFYGSTVTWWENTDRKGLLWHEHVVEVDFYGARTVSAADIDGDGHMDLLSGASVLGHIKWWQNEDGRAVSWKEHTISDDFEGVKFISADDLDGDGDLDIWGGAYGPFNNFDNIRWWENTAGNATSWTESIIDQNFEYSDAADSADMDGDGDIDVLRSSNETGTLTWLENNGSGTEWVKQNIDACYTPVMHAADVDEDGDMDVIGVKYTDGISWWENINGGGLTWTRHTFDKKFDSANDIHAVDVDADGSMDVLGAMWGMDYHCNGLILWKNVSSTNKSNGLNPGILLLLLEDFLNQPSPSETADQNDSL